MLIRRAHLSTSQVKERQTLSDSRFHTNNSAVVPLSGWGWVKQENKWSYYGFKYNPTGTKIGTQEVSSNSLPAGWFLWRRQQL